MTLFVASVAVAFSVSFLCSLVEAALLSLTPSQVADLNLKHPKVGAVWQHFKTNIEKPIAAILILNTAAHTVGSIVSGSQFNELFSDKWIWVYSLLFTFLMLQYTEILPKTLGVRFNRELAAIIATPLSIVIGFLTPLIRLIHWINRPFEMGKGRQRAAATLEEILALATLARISKQIGSHQERIIQGAFRLSQLRVRQVMIPLEQVSFLSTSQNVADAVVTAHIDSHTRFPVCEAGDPNRVVGYINFKELIYHMRMNPADPTLQGIIRPVEFVGPDMSAADLLKMFVDQHVHMAIVRDASQKCLGLVTFEDLVEELVGDLEDEFDRLPRMFHPLSGGMWMVGGGVAMSEVATRLKLPLPDTHGSLSTWLTQRLRGTPRPGQEHHEAGADFVVRRVRRGKVFEASVTRREPSRTAAGHAPTQSLLPEHRT